MNQSASDRLSDTSVSVAFSLLEHLYFNERSLSSSHHFHIFKIKDFWFGEIQKGKLFEIRKDDRSGRPIENDVVCFKSVSKRSLFVRVTYVLNYEEASDFVKEGYFIFGFEIICEYSEPVMSWIDKSGGFYQ